MKYWMIEQSKQSLWSLGTQPILRIVSVGDLKWVNKRWNVINVGRTKNHFIPESTITNGYILHWNGDGKTTDHYRLQSLYVLHLQKNHGV